MNWLMLRGFVPTDRDPEEIKHDSLEEDDDMWTHLFAGMLRGDDFGMVLYLDRNHRSYSVKYSDRLVIRHMPLISGALPVFSKKVDVVFARGGHPEYDSFIKTCGATRRIYYGAGRRMYPANCTDWDIVLVDDVRQLQQDKTYKTVLFAKPAHPWFFHRSRGLLQRRYHVCFVANGQQESFKGVRQVYETVPDDLSVLHLGFPPSMPIPKNVKQLRVLRKDMPALISRCSVGIAPYWNDIDSGPRCVAEMLACGLPVVAADQLRCHDYDCGVLRAKDMAEMWDIVRARLGWKNILPEAYSLGQSSKHLREVICGT